MFLGVTRATIPAYATIPETMQHCIPIQRLDPLKNVALERVTSIGPDH